MARDANDVHRELGIDGLRERGDRLPDLDFKEPAPRAKGNGLDAAVQAARFELIPFDKIAFDTTPAYLVKGIDPARRPLRLLGPAQMRQVVPRLRHADARRARLAISRPARSARRRRLLRIRRAARP